MGNLFSCHSATEFQNQEVNCIPLKSMYSERLSVRDSLSNYSCNSLSSASHDELGGNDELVKYNEAGTRGADIHQLHGDSKHDKQSHAENDVPPKRIRIKTSSKIGRESTIGKQRGWGSTECNQCEGRDTLSDSKDRDQVKNVDSHKTLRSLSAAPTSSSKSDCDYEMNDNHSGSLLRRFLRLKKSPQSKEKDTLNQKSPKSKERTLLLVNGRSNKHGSSSSSKSCDPVLVRDEHYVLMEWSNPGEKGRSGLLASHWRVRARQQEKL